MDKDLFVDFDEELSEERLNVEERADDDQQEMFEHYRFDISSGQEPMRVGIYVAPSYPAGYQG